MEGLVLKIIQRKIELYRTIGVLLLLLLLFWNKSSLVTFPWSNLWQEINWDFLYLYLLSFIDNNKDRKPKRELIAKEKRKLEEAIAAYNSLMSDTETVDTADAVLSQDFPLWLWDSDICIFLHYIACIFISLLFLILFLSDISHIQCICLYTVSSTQCPLCYFVYCS